MDGFDQFVDNMSGELTDSDSKLLDPKSYDELLKSDKFREKFRERFRSEPPADLQALDQNPGKKSYVVKVLKARKQFTKDLETPETRSKLLQKYGKRRFDFHKKNTSNLMETLKNPGNVVPLVTKKATSGLKEVHTKVSSAAAEHYKSLQEAIKKRSTERQER
jgi:hypothetical protein